MNQLCVCVCVSWQTSRKSLYIEVSLRSSPVHLTAVLVLVTDDDEGDDDEGDDDEGDDDDEGHRSFLILRVCVLMVAVLRSLEDINTSRSSS